MFRACYITCRYERVSLVLEYNKKKFCDGLFDNEFFKNTMSYSRFQIIRHAFQANVSKFITYFNVTNKKYWKLGNYICINDDLNKCESKTDEKRKYYLYNH